MYEEKSKKKNDGFFKKHWKKGLFALGGITLLSFSVVSFSPKVEFSIVDFVLFEKPPESLDVFLKWCHETLIEKINENGKNNNEKEAIDKSKENNEDDNSLQKSSVNGNESIVVPNVQANVVHHVTKEIVIVSDKNEEIETKTTESQNTLDSVENMNPLPPQLDSEYEPTSIPWIY